MKIDGRIIAQKILDDLKTNVAKLSRKPHLAIILIGDDPASVSYVNSKIRKAEQIGAKATLTHLSKTTSEQNLFAKIQQYNNEDNISGIIVQRPLPVHINSKKVDELTSPNKDIDGFNSHSYFKPPLPLAVIEILKHVHPDAFENWLPMQNIVVIGKGETGGGPIIEYLKSLHIEPTVVDSKTTNPQLITQNADIIITTVGKQGLITKNNIKPGVILIGVGMHKGKDGKLHGDYEESEIEQLARFYTPIPGGVGPVNVAMLLSNLIKAKKN